MQSYVWAVETAGQSSPDSEEKMMSKSKLSFN